MWGGDLHRLAWIVMDSCSAEDLLEGFNRSAKASLKTSLFVTVDAFKGDHPLIAILADGIGQGLKTFRQLSLAHGTEGHGRLIHFHNGILDVNVSKVTVTEQGVTIRIRLFIAIQTVTRIPKHF